MECTCCSTSESDFPGSCTQKRFDQNCVQTNSLHAAEVKTSSDVSPRDLVLTSKHCFRTKQTSLSTLLPEMSYVGIVHEDIKLPSSAVINMHYYTLNMH